MLYNVKAKKQTNKKVLKEQIYLDGIMIILHMMLYCISDTTGRHNDTMVLFLQHLKVTNETKEIRS